MLFRLVALGQDHQVFQAFRAALKQEFQSREIPDADYDLRHRPINGVDEADVTRITSSVQNIGLICGEGAWGNDFQDAVEEFLTQVDLNEQSLFLYFCNPTEFAAARNAFTRAMLYRLDSTDHAQLAAKQTAQLSCEGLI